MCVIAQQRLSNAFLRDERRPLVEEADGRLRWWTFAGGAGNRVLAVLLEKALGERVFASNLSVTISGEAAKSDVAVKEAVAKLRPPFQWVELMSLVPESNARVSKFQPCLPPAQEQGLLARELMDPEAAAAAIGDKDPVHR